jgi:hypothetical protein
MNSLRSANANAFKNQVNSAFDCSWLLLEA